MTHASRVSSVRRQLARLVPVCGAALALGGCAVTGTEPAEAEGPPARETVLALTASGELLRFNAGQPRRVQSSVPVKGLRPGDSLVGIDFRVAKGVLFAVGRMGQVYTLDSASGQLTAVGSGTPSVALLGQRFGVDFNPALDRIRVVSDTGQNLRFHPDTGAQIDFDPATPGPQADPDLRFAPGDAQQGHRPQVVSAAYTYNTRDEKLTTNYVLDARLGTLAMQGSLEGAMPVESPNLGVLRTVGPLGTGPLTDASFDISDVRNTALAVVRTPQHPRARLFRLDLATGQATAVGTVGQGQPLIGMAIEP